MILHVTTLFGSSKKEDKYQMLPVNSTSPTILLNGFEKHFKKLLYTLGVMGGGHLRRMTTSEDDKYIVTSRGEYHRYSNEKSVAATVKRIFRKCQAFPSGRTIYPKTLSKCPIFQSSLKRQFTVLSSTSHLGHERLGLCTLPRSFSRIISR